MRIIAGSLRRKTLTAPQGQLTRPTSDRTREAIFNLVESRMSLHGADVLDLFAGTGSLGLEAISRGATSVTFVEESAQVLKYTRKNAEDLGVTSACWFLRAEVVTYLARYRGPAYDLILADPPYDLAALARLPDLALPHLKPGGLFVLEHDTRISFEDHPQIDTIRSYGRTHVSIFHHLEDDLAEGDA